MTGPSARTPSESFDSRIVGCQGETRQESNAHTHPVISVNGERLSSDTHVSARDRGFTLADGVFETMRVRRGVIFRLDRHLARLHGGLLALHIPAPPRLKDWVLEAVAAGGDGDASVRLTVTRGVGRGGLTPSVESGPTTAIAVAPMPVFPPAVYESGLAGHVVSGRRNERAITSGLKSLAYVESVAGLLEAQRAGADEAIFLDTEEHCSEASASNLFVWTGTALITPPQSCAALPGITRATVLELAYGLRIEVNDDAFGLERLQEGAEAFLTSSLRGIAPLVRVDGRPIGDGIPGRVTARLAAAYHSLVERECAG